MNKILIIGSIPPPIGGVTIHVQRLLLFLNNNKISYDHINLKEKSIFNILVQILNYKHIHLHSSNVYYRLIITFYCFLTNKKLIITFHGNLGRYNKIKNILDLITIKISYIPIVLNKGSFNKAIHYNKRTTLISAFLPPITTNKLPEELTSQIKENKIKYSHCFSTNAYNLSYDKNRNEIYGIINLIEIFSKVKKYCLYISDPSGNYYKFITSLYPQIPENIKIINYSHNYFELLKHVDCMIRNTSTDGDALSVKEALFLNKIVLATSVVSRPKGVYTYKTDYELEKLLTDFESLKHIENLDLSGENKLLKLYHKLGK